MKTLLQLLKKYGVHIYDNDESAIKEVEKEFLQQAVDKCFEGNEWVLCSEQKPEMGHDPEFPFASEFILLSDGEFCYYGQYEKDEDGFDGFIDSNGDDFSDDGVKIIKWRPLPSTTTKEQLLKELLKEE